MDTDAQDGAPLEREKFSQLILTFDRTKFELTIRGITTNYNEAINMLEMATREFKAKIEAARAVEASTVTPARGFQLPFGRRH